MKFLIESCTRSRDYESFLSLLYLRVQELYEKWVGCKIPNWAIVRNQLLMDARMVNLMECYDTAY